MCVCVCVYIKHALELKTMKKNIYMKLCLDNAICINEFYILDMYAYIYVYIYIHIDISMYACVYANY